MKAHEFIYTPRGSPENTVLRFIWKTTRAGCGIEKETILPKGTAEIIFSLEGTTSYYKDDPYAAVRLPSCFINGLNTSPVHLLKSETQTFLGLQLHSSGLKYLFGIPASEFTDAVLDGFAVCPSLKSLSEALSAEKEFRVQVSHILQWVRNRVRLKNHQLEKCIRFDLYRHRAVEQLSIKALCREYGFSDRHLRRLSHEHLGINAAYFILYQKYLKALFSIHQNKSTSLTAIAHESGFYDQSHFIREFKNFAHMTPGEYRAQMSHLPGHIYRSMSV